MKTIGVLTSGGDAPGMNAAVRAVVRTACENHIKVYGIDRGYKGLMEGSLIPMEIRTVCDIIHRGGTMLHSARSLQPRKVCRRLLKSAMHTALKALLLSAATVRSEVQETFPREEFPA